MADLPSSVEIHEEGPREGFQLEPPSITTAAKVQLIEALAETGLQHIACASFVNPKRVPQMADAQQIADTVRRKPGVRYTGMWLNESGFERALASTLQLSPNIVASASNEFSIRNNNCDSQGLLERQARLLEHYAAAGVALEAAHVFTAFGCYFEGRIGLPLVISRVDELLRLAAEHDTRPELVYFCDTIGAANPEQVRRTLGAARERWPDQAFALHLHDTRGMGLANALAGLQMGVRVFDTSIGGLGGCPFAGHRGAAGNISTEDFALMCEEMGIETGLDIDALLECAKLAESIVEHPLPARAFKAGRVPG
ncbi:MAG: hydroxymethylglutaryl-CoA lyase [Burkholderiaceae bacterium]